jgi:hypothetical protein
LRAFAAACSVHPEEGWKVTTPVGKPPEVSAAAQQFFWESSAFREPTLRNIVPPAEIS